MTCPPPGTPAPFPVTVHPFPSPTPNACAYERGSPQARNAIVFIGGLTGGPHTLDLGFLARALEQAGAAGDKCSSTTSSSPSLSYSLWEFRMRSSYSGFGFSSLANDVDDTAALVRYLRAIGKEKVVLMGCSTGMARLPTSLHPYPVRFSFVVSVGGRI